MRLVLFLSAIFYFLSVYTCYDMIVGDTVHKKMVFHQRVKDFAIPFKKRIKTLTFSDPEKRIIKVIYFLFAFSSVTDIYSIIVMSIYLVKNMKTTIKCD